MAEITTSVNNLIYSNNSEKTCLVFEQFDSERVDIEAESNLRFTGADVAARVWWIEGTRY